MPAEGVTLSPRSELLTRAELLRLTRVFAALGVEKLRLTGGEPTVRADLVDIVREYIDYNYNTLFCTVTQAAPGCRYEEHTHLHFIYVVH